MIVLALGCVFLILIIPLAVWALVALAFWPGLVLAVGLLACAAGWLALMCGWVATDQVTNTVLALAVLTPMLIIAGRLTDRVAVIRRAPPGRFWVISAHSLPDACVGLNVLVFIAVIVAALYAEWGYTPPNSDVLPLPAALTVVSDQDRGCADSCEREIDVMSAGRLSPERTAQVVVVALTSRHGWRMGPYQSGCRREGWLLGREDVCVHVQTGQNAVQVLLEGEP
jgi:hypothetical protein